MQNRLNTRKAGETAYIIKGGTGEIGRNGEIKSIVFINHCDRMECIGKFVLLVQCQVEEL